MSMFKILHINLIKEIGFGFVDLTTFECKSGMRTKVTIWLKYLNWLH